jgi:hypothetical protein
MLTIRQAMQRPQRKPPQLLKVPFYEKAEALFRRECSNVTLVGLELERGMHGGQECWVFAAYTGPRGPTGLTVNHFVPMTKLSWEEVRDAVMSLANTSRRVWQQREDLRHAREKLERDIQQSGERRRDLYASVSGPRPTDRMGR